MHVPVTLIYALTLLSIALDSEIRPAQSASHGGSATAATSPVLAEYVKNYPNLSIEDARELPMRLRSLLQDEYMFFRGTADEFYRWCVVHCADWRDSLESWVLLHGDVHIGNVGAFSMDGERDSIRFGLVDLDECFEGPFQLDLLRALVSIRFAARSRGAVIDDAFTQNAANVLVESYVAAMRGDLTESALKSEPAVAALLKKSARNSPAAVLKKYVVENGESRFRRVRLKGGEVTDILDPVDPPTRQAVTDAMGRYIFEGCDAAVRRQFALDSHADVAASLLDVARRTRIRSSGSQGVHKYFVLLRRPLADRPEDYIFEMKEQPVPAAIRAGFAPRRADDPAARVARALHRYYGDWPQLVGHTQMNGRSFEVTLRDPFAEELELDDFPRVETPEGAGHMACILGAVIGMAHRTDLQSSSRTAAVHAITVIAAGLSQDLAGRAAEADAHLRNQYDRLRKDSVVMRQVEEANSALQAAKASN